MNVFSAHILRPQKIRKVHGTYSFHILGMQALVATVWKSVSIFLLRHHNKQHEPDHGK